MLNMDTEIRTQIGTIVDFINTEGRKEAACVDVVNQKIAEVCTDFNFCINEKHFHMQLENEVENITLLLESKINMIQEEKYKIEQSQERLEDELKKVSDDLRQKKIEKSQALAKEEEVKRQLRATEEKLAEMEKAFLKYKDEAASVEKMVENIPKLSETRTLMYKISRLTFDVTKKEGVLKGFVVNPLKDDVNTFTFNKNDQGVSSHFITNHLWDIIGAGVSDQWSKF